MPLGDRIQFPQTSVLDERDRGLNSYVTQPPLGCDYYYTGSTTVTLPDANATTTLDFRTDGTIDYDPYNLIDTTNDRVTLPTPGIYYLAAEVHGTQGSDGFVVFSQITQGSAAVSQQKPFLDLAWISATSAEFHAHISGLLYVDRAWIATNTYVYVKCLSNDIPGTATGTARLTKFSMWLLSASPPGKY